MRLRFLFVCAIIFAASAARAATASAPAFPGPPHNAHASATAQDKEKIPAEPAAASTPPAADAKRPAPAQAQKPQATATKSPAHAPAAAPITHVGGIDVPKQAYAQGMIQKYIRAYTGTESAKQALVQTLDEGEPYRLYIRQELKKRQMPAALEYLPVVESEYKPRATSRSGARGLWQFMENSIAPFMKKDEWIDERLDPWKSTDAALSKLQDNYRMFGDWAIAIAAYNCGAGAMRRILDESPQKSFWYLAENGLLRDQSVQYVPKFLAISELSEHGAKYGIQLPAITTSTRFAEFDYVTVKGQVSLERLASELRLDYDTLARLNGALVKSCTPPATEYAVRLPAGMERAATLALRSIAVRHTVTQGETLFALSRLYGCSVDDICAANEMRRDDVLAVGKVLYIPAKHAET